MHQDLEGSNLPRPRPLLLWGLCPHGMAGITVSPSLKRMPSISAREKLLLVVSCRISAFMLWLMCLAHTTWKVSGWLHGGGTKAHLRWTLWPTSSGVMTGLDSRGGATAAGDTWLMISSGGRARNRPPAHLHSLLSDIYRDRTDEPVVGK